MFYHGTNSTDFTVFDSSKSSKKVRLNVLGDGYYFSTDKDSAQRYGANVMEEYLCLKNPYCVYGRDGGIKAQMSEDFRP